jgi:hypothetical protein
VNAGPFVLQSDATDVATFGGSIEPPDTQLAAGPTQLFELVNDVGQVYTKTGTTVGATLNLNTFFPVPAGMFFTDPRVIFDAESGRWFLSGLAFNSTNFTSQVMVAISSGSDAAASTYNFFVIPFNTGVNNAICDQPKLGVNSDKVTVSCSNFTSNTTFTHESTFFINKSEMVAATTPHAWEIDDARLFAVQPVTALTPTPTEYLVENDSVHGFCGSSSLWLASVTGVPSVSQPNPPGIPILCFGMAATAIPPAAQQPAGGNATVNTNDDRFNSAVWRNGTLWTGGNNACTPIGDTVVRSCLRLATIQTLDGIMQNTNFASNGAYLYYPGLSLDGSNDLFVSYTESSSTVNPGAVAFDLPALSFTPEAFTVVQGGAAAYNSTNASGPRWGDYSAAAVDPTNSANVWVTAEFAAAAGTFNWSTATAELSVPAPAASTIAPTSGQALGGTPVTISGTAFHPGATVKFGNNLATSAVVAPGGASLTATTPSGVVGATTVTVTNPDGTSTTVPGGFSYTAPAPVGTTFFFAEGNTISGFTETLYLFTPNTSGNAQVTYQTDTGPVGPISHALTAGQVTTVDVLNDLGGVNHIGVSAEVVLPGPGVAERGLNFSLTSAPNWHGTENKVGATAPNSTWLFAEGSTHPAYSEFLTLQNPDPATASNVSINYFTDRGAVVQKTLTIQPQHRVTVEVFTAGTSANCAIDPTSGAAQGCGVGPNVIGVSTQVTVTSGPAIVAERPMYVNGFDFGSGPIRDGHDAFGANSAAGTWNFAEGTSIGGFNEYLTLLNADATNASNVNIDYFTEQGTHVTKTITLPHSSRTTVEVFNGSLTNSSCAISNGVAVSCGVGGGVTGVSTKVSVTSGPNIVAERPMYISFDFGTGIVAGADDVVGATSLGTVFGFSYGQTTAGENDYLTIQNSGAQAATVTIAYYDAAGGFPRTATIVVFGNSRRTVRTFLPPSQGPGDVGPGFANLGIVVSSDQPILVEEPTYSSVAVRYGAADTIGFTPAPAF